MAVFMSSAAILPSAAQIPVFSDTFENGSVTNSDTITNFWKLSIPTYCSIAESGGKLVLTAGSNASPNGSLATNVCTQTTSDEYNFFKKPIRFTSDVSMTGQYGALRFCLTSSTSNCSTGEDAIVLTLYSDNRVSLSVKQDRTNIAPEVVTNLISNLNVGSTITGFDLTLNSTDYTLIVKYTSGSRTLTGSHGLVAAQWGVDGKSAMQLEAVRFSAGAIGAGITTVSTVDNLSVTSLETPAIFQDAFNNGAPLNSDMETGIWTSVLQETSSLGETTGWLTQTASSDVSSVSYVVSNVSTPVQNRFNFFDRQLKFAATVTIGGTTSASPRIRLLLASQSGYSASASNSIMAGFYGGAVNLTLATKTNGVGIQPDNFSTYAAISANKLLLQNDEAFNIYTAYSGYDGTTPFNLKLNSKRYQFNIANIGRGTKTVRFSGEHQLARSQWGSNGDSALVLETVRRGTATASTTAVGSWNNLSVTTDSSLLLNEPYWKFSATYASAYGGTSTGSYRLWLPATEPVIRGIIFLGPGDGDTVTQYLIHDPYIQEVARTLGFGLIGYNHDSRMNLDTGNYTAAIQAAVQAVLDAAATISNHPEISNAPLCAMGLSRGSFDSCYLARNWPERVITVVPFCGGEWNNFTMTEAIRAVPVLFVPGGVDGNSLTDPFAVQTDFTIWRSQSGRVAYAVNWNGGHDCSDNQGWEAAGVWISEIARLRYPRTVIPSLKSGTAPTLLTINDANSWLGERAFYSAYLAISQSQTFPNIAPVSSFSGTASTASWLPSETMARAYRAMTATDRTTRLAIPYQTPVRIVSPAQYMQPISLGNAVTIEIDPRDFDNSYVLASVDFYDGNVWLGADSSGPEWKWNYTPTTTGLHSLSVVATDVLGNKSPAFRVIHVLPTDFPPVARSLYFTLAAGATQTGTLTGSDPEGNPITAYTVTQQPSHGSLVVNASSGAYTYIANSTYSGVDAFTYTVTDGTLSSTAATASITVVGLQVGNIATISAAPGASEGRITLTWSAAANAEYYNVERSTSSNSGFVQVATVSAPLVSYTDNNLTMTQTYSYRLKAIYQGTASSYSSVVSSLPNNPYSAVGKTTSLAAAPGVHVGSVTLTWSATANATSYRADFASTSSGPFTTLSTVSAPILSTTLGDLSVGSPLYFRITPYNPAYTGTSSDIVSASPYFPATMDSWCYVNFGGTAVPGVTGDLDTPYDQTTNLMRYALGFNFYNPDGDFISLTPTDMPYVKSQSLNGTPYLTCTFIHNKSASDLTIRVQVASDPNGPWTDINPFNAANQASVADNTPGTGQETIVVKDTQPITDSTKRFMRVRVTR